MWTVDDISLAQTDPAGRQRQLVSNRLEQTLETLPPFHLQPDDESPGLHARCERRLPLGAILNERLGAESRSLPPYPLLQQTPGCRPTLVSGQSGSVGSGEAASRPLLAYLLARAFSNPAPAGPPAGLRVWV